ncbi:16S rRNA (adenine1518-N6/adenine1519-N6)-dimethyltransferase [Bartonella sp. Raccoon60]|nr:16S rRNA (adenine1518-N6/adenine1519-N6)-dimethyltransferase [Bartonella sp. Raccoon60]
MLIDNLPPLRNVISKYKLQANKSLGQNFIFDLNLTAKIAHQAGNIEGKPVLEIGPGPGGLTRALLAKGAIVTAIERDERCMPALLEIEEHYPQKLKLIFNDALKQDFPKLFEAYPEKPRIIANLPYNIGTQLLLNWLLTKSWPLFMSQ